MFKQREKWWKKKTILCQAKSFWRFYRKATKQHTSSPQG